MGHKGKKSNNKALTRIIQGCPQLGAVGGAPKSLAEPPK